jgi:hypothetical protein
MVPDLAGGGLRQAVAGNGRENLKNIEENGGMALGRISLMPFDAFRRTFSRPFPSSKKNFVLGAFDL